MASTCGSGIKSTCAWSGIVRAASRVSDTRGLPQQDDYKQMPDSITREPCYQRNLDWGQGDRVVPRDTVRAHIDELERNLGALRNKLA
jgi:hypothetical protein